MRLAKKKRQTRAVINMTPMIDIVFLLIIFFMTVSQVSKVNKERLELPKQEGSEDQESAELTINVDQRGQMVISGFPVTLDQLVTLAADQVVELENDPSRLTVVLRVDRNAESRTVNDVVNALARLQLTRVRMAVQVPQGE